MEKWDEPELLGVTRTEVAETTVRGGAGSRGKAIAALVVVTVMGFLALQASRGSDEPNPDSAVNGVTGEDAQPDSTDEATTSTTRPKRTTTTRAGVIVAGEPLFDYETGWDLFLGNDGMELTHLSLDDGSYQEFNRGYWPAGIVGDTLLLAGNSQNLRWLKLSNLDARPEAIQGTMNQGLFFAAGGLPDLGLENQAWLPAGNYDAQTWQLWDFAGAEPVLVREIESVPNNYGPSSVHPTIISSPSGGIYEGEPDDLERVADGRLLSVSNLHVVVEQCSTPFDCEVLWIRRDSWERDVGVVVPPIRNSSFLWGMRASDDGKWVFVPDFETGKSLIWNLQTGEAESELFVEGATFSPDSRFVAGSTRSGDLAVLDLETGEVAEWNVPGSNFYGGVVFAPAS
jgi:hypothetical protein